MMSFPSDTDENSPVRPVPKPRRSLGNTLGLSSEHNDQQTEQERDDAQPPSYSSVSDTDPALLKVCSNDNDPGWMVVPKQEPSPTDNNAGASGGNQAEYCVVSVSHPGSGDAGSSVDPSQPPAQPSAPLFPNNAPPPVVAPYIPTLPFPPCQLQQMYIDSGAPPSYNSVFGPQPPPVPAQEYPSPAPAGWNVPQNQPRVPPPRPPVTYPPVSPQTDSLNTACREYLMLRFGKLGASVRDFIKPFGLAVSSDGDYIISDNGGNQNRLFIYNSAGDLKSAFKCGCKVKDIAITSKDDILAAVHKDVAAVRLFSMAGQIKAEYGKNFTYEEPSGVVELSNGGVVITGIENHCVYVFTNQMKLSVKFGSKGNGDGYFLHPGHVATDSRNHIIVSDKINNSVQVFGADGKFKFRFGSTGAKNGQLKSPHGICTDNMGNIIVADSGNHRVEVFTARGRWLSRVVSETHMLGEQVQPVNVAWTPTGKVAVLLRGPYFAEVRVYSSNHQSISQPEASVSSLSSVWYYNS